MYSNYPKGWLQLSSLLAVYWGTPFAAVCRGLWRTSVWHSDTQESLGIVWKFLNHGLKTMPQNCRRWKWACLLGTGLGVSKEAREATRHIVEGGGDAETSLNSVINCWSLDSANNTFSSVECPRYRSEKGGSKTSGDALLGKAHVGCQEGGGLLSLMMNILTTHFLSLGTEGMVHNQDGWEDIKYVSSTKETSS